MVSSVRYLGGAVGFGFGVMWMAVGLGSAIACLLLAGLGYGVVFMAERARTDAGTRRKPVVTDDFDLDHDDERDDATTPLAAEAEYGWPWPTGDDKAETPEVVGTPR